jgi:hypothetical protein
MSTTRARVKLPGGRVVRAAVGDIDLDDEIVLRSDGSRYTEADVAADAVELLSRSPGKPSLSGEGISPQIGVRLPAELRRRLAVRAARDGVRESEVVRAALAAFLG